MTRDEVARTTPAGHDPGPLTAELGTIRRSLELNPEEIDEEIDEEIEKEVQMGGYSEALDCVIANAVAPTADWTDRGGRFPHAALDEMADAGLLGLISALEVGGSGLGLPEATDVVGRIARHCTSTAMVVCMHYAATAVIEAFGPVEVREQIAAGEHLSTLAFSERGSRSHFWAPLSTARAEDGSVVLDANKSWVTSAGAADSYVWSSRPSEADGMSTLWLVPSSLDGIKVNAPFDGLGLRGNDSSPVSATAAMLPAASRLGEDGAGFDIMIGTVLPWFSLMSASISAGLMQSALDTTVDHLTSTRLDHLGYSLADQPVSRNQLARAKVDVDLVLTLLEDSVRAVDEGMDSATLRVLEVKAAAADTAIAVTDSCMRLCGGAAFRKELGVERRFRDARAAAVMAPTSDAVYEFIGKAMCGLPVFSKD